MPLNNQTKPDDKAPVLELWEEQRRRVGLLKLSSIDQKICS